MDDGLDFAGAMGGALSDEDRALEAERMAPRDGDGAAEKPKSEPRSQEPRVAPTPSQPDDLEKVRTVLSGYISALDPAEMPKLDFALARLVRQLSREQRSGGSSEPSTQALDPALLDDTVERIRRHLIVTDEQADAMALWTLGAHVFDHFDVSPPLHIASPVRRTGKTRALDTLGLLVPKAWGPVVQPSEAVLYRYIERARPTLLLDEVDSIFGRKAEQVEGVRALLNAGNQRGTTVPRCVGTSNEIVHFSVYCPKVLAGIGELPDTISDRSIPIQMKRKLRSEKVERIRRHTRVAVGELHEEIAAWAASLGEDDIEWALADVEPLVDDNGELASLDDRAWEQAWEPLICLAVLAGDAWLRRAIRAAVTLSGNRDADTEQAPAIHLLHDIRVAFGPHERLPTADLILELLKIEDAPWAERWAKHGGALEAEPGVPRKLANMLRPFGVRPTDIWWENRSVKGYERASFKDAWTRYAPNPPILAASAARTASESNKPALPIREETSSPRGKEMPANPDEQRDLAALADRNDETEGDGPKTAPEDEFDALLREYRDGGSG